MSSACMNFVVVFNGEIYNYIELRHELTSLGRTFKTSSDTEVLLAAYQQWGTTCVQRLNGMFAFGILDRRRRQIFIARDRFGEKPLFYCRLPDDGIAFASEIKALTLLPGVRVEENRESSEAFFRGAYRECEQNTFFKNILRFPAAHCMVVNHLGKIERLWRFWTPSYEDVDHSITDSRAIGAFRALFQESIKIHMRADVPVGTSLSGGLDSSYIVCMLTNEARRYERFNQRVFSARFSSDREISEGPQIDQVVEHSGVQAFSVEPTPADLVDDITKLHWHQEEPFPSASIFLQWKVMQLARQHNTTVLLDGQGADELLAGYAPYFQLYQLDLLAQRRFATLLAETKSYRARARVAAAMFEKSDRRFNADVALGLRELLMRSLTAVCRLNTEHARAGIPIPERSNNLRRQLAADLQYDNLQTLLRYADRNSMAYSLEVRLPFLDYRFVDFCIRLPERLLIRNGWQKYIVRMASDGVLPTGIQWRFDKVGFAAPLDKWLRSDLKDWAYDRILSRHCREHPMFDETMAKSLWEQHQTGTANVSWALWRWISYGEWRHSIQRQAWKAS